MGGVIPETSACLPGALFVPATADPVRFAGELRATESCAPGGAGSVATAGTKRTLVSSADVVAAGPFDVVGVVEALS
jgi:hypothetical protein